MRRPATRNRDENGAVLVEYAFAFPVLLTAVVAGMSFLWAAFVQVQAGQAAREGARYATVALRPTYRTHPDADAVVQRVKDRVPVLHLTTSDVTVAYPGCPSPCSPAPSNWPVTVTVQKTLPSVMKPFVALIRGSGTITASSGGEGREE